MVVRVMVVAPIGLGVAVVVAVMILLVRARLRRAAASAAGLVPNEFLKDPPTSFPRGPVTLASLGLAPAEPEGGAVIDLRAIEAETADRALDGIIDRERFAQLCVEQLAADLAGHPDRAVGERSDLGAPMGVRRERDEPRTFSELTMFNSAVPTFPGQMTAFAEMSQSEKKRVMVRVLCLLVAESEKSELPRRSTEVGAETQGWLPESELDPVAPVEAGLGEPDVPDRDLAPSG